MYIGANADVAIPRDCPQGKVPKLCVKIRGGGSNGMQVGDDPPGVLNFLRQGATLTTLVWRDSMQPPNAPWMLYHLLCRRTIFFPKPLIEDYDLINGYRVPCASVPSYAQD